jgi:ferredoxin
MYRTQRLFASNQDDEDFNQLDRDEFIEMLKENPDLLEKFESRKRDYAETDPNLWLSSDTSDDFDDAFTSTWDEKLNRQDDDWSAFTNLDTSSSDEDFRTSTSSALLSPEDDGEEAWLNTLQSISAEEINFMSKEADRADNVRQMQEFGFGEESISATLDVATDDELERDLDNQLFEAFKEETSKSGFGMYVEDDVDLETVESHTRVDWDDELDEPVRSQMVYVDEHTCIGCTNCAMIAQSTFFMEPEHGRARVFRQWGDDDETIQVAIETCPVDCIHYVPFDELKKLEIQRRDQNINFKARLVNQGDYQASYGNAARYGGSRQFTEPPKISGNMGARCNNCPSKGCANCPMYGVGLNIEFKKKEKLRKERLQKAAIKRRRESEEKRAEL